MSNDNNNPNPRSVPEIQPVSAPEESQTYRSRRRRVLSSVVAGTGAVVAGKSLPPEWARPVINSVVLPAHAQTSPGESFQCEVTLRESDGTVKFTEGSYTVGNQIDDSTQDVAVDVFIPGAEGKVVNLDISGTGDAGDGEDDGAGDQDSSYFADISGPTDQDAVVPADGLVSFSQLSADPTEFFDADDTGNDATLTIRVSCPGFEDCVIDLSANNG